MITIEMFNEAIRDYEQEKARVNAENYESEIVAKVKEYEKQVREEYAVCKANKIHDIDLSIEAVKRLKEKAEQGE